MGALCSVDRGGHAPNEAPDQAYSPDSAHSPRVIHKRMPPSWITEKVTRQKMREINGETTFTSVKSYEEARATLIARENSQAFDGRAVATASDLEKRANELISAIRKADEEDVYGILKDRHGRQRTVADHFLGNVDLINKTQLLRVAKKMPKGAHLHCHFNSCLRPEFLIEHARGRESMYIRSTCPLTSDQAMQQAEISFLVQPPQPEGVNLFSENYVAQSWMKYPKFCEIFPGGLEAAEKWLLWKMLLNEEEVYDTYQTGTQIWKRFDVCTRMIKGLFSYESAFKAYTRACIEDFINDNIQYAEIRPNFPSNALVRDDGIGYIDNTGLLQIIADGIEEQKKSGRYFGGMKVIYCTPRSFSNKAIEDSLNECIELKKKFPELLCGYDLVGSEDRGRPLRDFIKELLEFREKCNREVLDIPFMFHCGETLDTGSSTDQNLFDAILLNSKRIGHGYALPKHPEAMRLIKEKGIALEICPISNEVLGLCSTIRGHTLPILLANNVPCTVNSDNGTFYSSTLSHDFYQVMVGSQSMSLHGWRVLAEWSLEHSCMSPSEKSQVKKKWLDSWGTFCQWIIDEYGGKYPATPRSSIRHRPEPASSYYGPAG